MGKLVVLNIVDGDFENGFPVFLEIANDGDYPFAEQNGKLPSATQLIEHYEDWQKPYSSIVSSLRSSRMSGTDSQHSSMKSEAKAASQKLNSSLNHWLKSPGMQSISNCLYKNLKNESENIRVIVKTTIPELQRLPWHLWDDFFQHYRRAEVALNLPVQRQQTVNTREKTRILAVFGKTEAFGNTTKINTEKDWESLKQHLSDAELIRMVEPSLEELYEQLEEKSPDLFFFAGHSSSEENWTRGIIELNQDQTITIDNLKPALREAVEGGLQLAIFNSCDGLGIARELADLHIPQIIVMREPIPDSVAQKFLRRFLEAFVGEERSVGLAVRRAREKIHPCELEFPGVTCLPIVFQNPAELPLTGREFRRIAIGVNSNQASPIGEVPPAGNQSQILWLPTNIGNPYQGQESSSTVVNPVVNPSEFQQESKTENTSVGAELKQSSAVSNQLLKGSGFLITCINCDHQNPVGNSFCICCGITLKEQEIGNGNSSLPVEPPPTIKAIKSEPDNNISKPAVAVNPSINLSEKESQSLPRFYWGSGNCINPYCQHPQNPRDISFCKNCGSQLLIDGRYWVVKPLGRGGFGMTYEVNEGGTPKVLKVLTYNDVTGVRLFQQEAHVLMRLRHPGLPVVEPNGYFTFTPNNSREPLHCLVMEKIAGMNLQEWLKNRNHQTIENDLAIDWLEQLARILHLVHSQNYFHRDIKPANIMIRPNGQLVLIDFGAVREVTESLERKKGDVTRIFTQGYTPPEQINGNAEPRSDFFALGRTFVYLLTGQEPRELEANPSSTKFFWRSFAPQISKPLGDLIDDMMNISVNGRPQDTLALMQRIAQLPTISTKTNNFNSTNLSIRIYSIVTLFVLSFLAGLALSTFAPQLLNPDPPSPPPIDNKDGVAPILK